MTQTALNKAESALIKPLSQELSPAYVWKESRSILLTRKERIVVDTFLTTRSYEACSKALKEAGFKRSALTCRRWLEIPTVKRYLEEQFEERGLTAGWTKGRWLKVMTDHVLGVERLKGGDLYAMKLIAAVCGFEGPQILNFNQSIEVVQANGRA